MKSSLSQAIEMFFDPRTIIPFLLGSIALGVLSDVVYQILCNLLGTSTVSAIGIGFAAFAILGLAVALVSYRIRQQTAMVAEPGYRSPRPRRGLVYLVSQKEPCLKAVEFHRDALERVWLVCSNRTAPIAESLKEEVAQVAPKLKGNQCVKICTVENVDEPKECFDVVKKIHRDLPGGWTHDDVITDYLGMTANASVGSALACVLHGWPLEYTQPKFDENRQLIGVLPPREISLRVQRRSQNAKG